MKRFAILMLLVMGFAFLAAQAQEQTPEATPAPVAETPAVQPAAQTPTPPPTNTLTPFTGIRIQESEVFELRGERPDIVVAVPRKNTKTTLDMNILVFELLKKSNKLILK